MFIDAVESPHAIRYTARPGKMVPLHVTATGRALLSEMAPSRPCDDPASRELRALHATTLMSVAAVEKEIKRSIERGWFEGDGRVHRPTSAAWRCR